MEIELNLNEIGKTENLLRTLDFWQEIESRLMNAKDGMLVIRHFPKKAKAIPHNCQRRQKVI